MSAGCSVQTVLNSLQLWVQELLDATVAHVGAPRRAAGRKWYFEKLEVAAIRCNLTMVPHVGARDDSDDLGARYAAHVTDRTKTSAHVACRVVSSSKACVVCVRCSSWACPAMSSMASTLCSARTSGHLIACAAGLPAAVRAQQVRRPSVIYGNQLAGTFRAARTKDQFLLSGKSSIDTCFRI